MPQITSSVGRGGRNRAADVVVVQELLNRHLASIGRIHPLVEDGVVGPLTINAIVRFQQRVVGTHNPDGRVDPSGRTIKVLNQEPIRLTELPSGNTDYYSYASADEQWGTRNTIRAIREAAKRMMQETSVSIGIGHISLENGGRFPPHKSHRWGVDVDVRPLRLDGARRAVTINNDNDYDQTRTRKLVRILREDPTLDLILFNDTNIQGVISATGHDNHLHVRYSK